MLLTITLEGVTRNFGVDKEMLEDRDWNEVLLDMLDTVETKF
mgnify:FL=1